MSKKLLGFDGLLDVMGSNTGKRRIQSADRVCDILEALRTTGGSTVSELAETVSLSPGTAHTYLATLESRGFVRKDDGKYHLGLELLPYGEHVRLQTDLYQAAREEVHQLAHNSGVCVHLMTEYRGQLLVLHEAFGKNAIGTSFHPQKGEQPETALHCTAAGKAILAHFSEKQVRQIIQKHGLVQYTSATITTEDELMAELEQIRKNGFAVNNQEHMRGIRAIGAPILYEGEQILGAISVSGSASNWSNDRFREELTELVTRAANAIEVNIHSQTEESI